MNVVIDMLKGNPIIIDISIPNGEEREREREALKLGPFYLCVSASTYASPVNLPRELRYSTRRHRSSRRRREGKKQRDAQARTWWSTFSVRKVAGVICVCGKECLICFGQDICGTRHRSYIIIDEN